MSTHRQVQARRFALYTFLKENSDESFTARFLGEKFYMKSSTPTSTAQSDLNAMLKIGCISRLHEPATVIRPHTWASRGERRFTSRYKYTINKAFEEENDDFFKLFK
jgi:hypothetical protein